MRKNKERKSKGRGNIWNTCINQKNKIKDINKIKLCNYKERWNWLNSNNQQRLKLVYIVIQKPFIKMINQQFLEIILGVKIGANQIDIKNLFNKILLKLTRKITNFNKFNNIKIFNNHQELFKQNFKLN